MSPLFRWSNGHDDAEAFQAADKTEFRANARDAALSLLTRGKNRHSRIELHVHGHPRNGQNPWRNVFDHSDRAWVLLDLSKPLQDETLDRVWSDIERRIAGDQELRNFLDGLGTFIKKELRKDN